MCNGGAEKEKIHWCGLGKRKKMLSFEALANFHDGNPPTVAEFKLPELY